MPKADPPQTIDADVCAYGATPDGIAAAIQATRMGRSAVLVEFGRHVGGMTASGLSATDGGRSAKGIADEFYRTVGARGFRPAAAEKQFRTMLAAAGSSTTGSSSARLRRRKRLDIVFVGVFLQRRGRSVQAAGR